MCPGLPQIRALGGDVGRAPPRARVRQPRLFSALASEAAGARRTRVGCMHQCKLLLLLAVLHAPRGKLHSCPCPMGSVLRVHRYQATHLKWCRYYHRAAWHALLANLSSVIGTHPQHQMCGLQLCLGQPGVVPKPTP